MNEKVVPLITYLHTCIGVYDFIYLGIIDPIDNDSYQYVCSFVQFNRFKCMSIRQFGLDQNHIDC